MTTSRRGGTGNTIIRRAADFCKQWDMLPAGGVILCAVSGGRDSMALLHILKKLSETENFSFSIAAAHFNHQLRPTANRDEEFVRGWCGEHKIPFFSGYGDVRKFAAQSGTGMEDAARTLRYAFLEETADNIGASRIAAAHHRDDNAETALLHLLRGAGLRGLCGIPPVRGRIVRPLLEISRSEIDAYIEACHIPYVEDETNCNTDYTRNRLRLEVMPLLEEIFPGCAGRVAGTCGLLREEDLHIQTEAEAHLPPKTKGETEIALPIPLLNRQDAALRRRLVRTMGQRLGVSLNREQSEAVLTLGSGGTLDLPEQVRAVRLPHKLILRKDAPAPEAVILQLGEQNWGTWRVTVQRCLETETTPEGAFSLALDGDAWPLSIGHWDGTGRLAVENGSRTLKRLFQDSGIPAARRSEHPVLFHDGRPIAAFGVAVDWDFRQREGLPCLAVSISPKDTEENP